MGKVLESKKTNVPRGRGARIKAIVRKMPRMPAAQSKRLGVLMEQSKRARLSKKEDRELRDLLDLIDRQTYWNLAQAIEIEGNRKMRKTG